MPDRHKNRLGALAAALLLLGAAHAPAAAPMLAGYSDAAAVRAQLEATTASGRAKLVCLTTTRDGGEVLLLRVAKGPADDKPALLVVAGTSPEHLVGTEVVLGLARYLTSGKPEADQLLDRAIFYLVPRAAPGLYSHFFQAPYFERQGNARPVDDDHDGLLDEDGPDDLDGDGVITQMRVEDPSGPLMEHPRDPRVLVEAKRSEGEQGRWKLFSEGLDNDHDEQFNEDGPGGVLFERNFPYRYAYFDPAAGPYAVSEPETKALADFAFDHQNIALVLCLGPYDNLMQPWKPAAAPEGVKPGEGTPGEAAHEAGPEAKLALPGGDAAILAHLAEIYRKIHGGQNAPTSPPAKGDFLHWAYFHYGRWALGTRAWWIPTVEADKDAAKGDKKDGDKKDGDKKEKEAKTGSPEDKSSKRGAEDLNALRWFAREKIDGFVPWKPFAHPDLPGQKVEVGGFKPFVRTNPPAAAIPALVEKHAQFVARLVDALPRLEIVRTKAEPLGKGVWRVTMEVLNRGYLPTMPQMGVTAHEPNPLQVAVKLPEGVALVTGAVRSQVPVLAGEGGRLEHSWLLTSSSLKPVRLSLRVWSPSVGEAEASVDLAAPSKEPKR